MIPTKIPVQETVRPRMEKIILSILLICLLFFAGCFVYHAFRLILYPYTIDYGEGYILDHAWQLSQGKSPYVPLGESPPWVVSNYPPFYPLLVAGGIKVFGIQLHFGRILSFIGILLASTSLLLLVRDQTGDWLAGWTAGLLWMCSYPVYNWGTHHRVDSVGIGLEALGLVLLFRRNSLNWSILFFILALYTRQTLWVGPLAGYFYLRRHLGAREAARWFAKLLLAGGLLFVFLCLLTRMEIYHHLVSYNINRFYWKDVWRMFHNGIMVTMKIPAILMFYYLFKTLQTRQWDLASIAIPFALLSFMLVGKIGSATNYMFELALVACWCSGLVLAEVRNSLEEPQPLRFLVPMLLIAGLLFPLHLPHFYGQWGIVDWGGTPIRGSEKQTSYLKERLQEIPGPILCQDAGLALISGHSVYWHPFVMTQLAEEERWDPTHLNQLIRQKHFNALVLPLDLDLDPDAWKGEEWWTQFQPETVAAIRASYRVIPANPPSSEFRDPRYRGYPSPFGTNYLYLPRS